MKKLLKKTGLGILGLLVILLIIGFLLPTERKIEVTEQIDAPVQLVFEQVNDLRNWENWSPWKELDPLMEMSYSNPPVGKGAFYKWTSDNPRIRSGKLTLVEVVPQQKIVTAMEFEDGNKGTSEFRFSEEKRATEVTWSMQLRFGRSPIGRYMGLFMAGGLRQMFDKGLTNMRVNMESH